MHSTGEDHILKYPSPDEVRWTEHCLTLPGRGELSIFEFRHEENRPTLLLLHGLATTGRLNWFAAFPALAERYDVVLLDHRGHGGGIRTDEFTFADCANDAVALADELGIEEFYPVGYSMGGPIAKLIAHRHPKRVRGLVLCATANRFTKPQTRSIATALLPGLIAGARIAPELFRGGIERTLLRNVRRGRREFVRAELRCSEPASVLQAARATLRFDSESWAAGIATPTAVVVTTRDTIVAPHRQYRLARSIPAAKTFEVDGDHLACVVSHSGFVPTLVDACDYVVGESGVARA